MSWNRIDPLVRLLSRIEIDGETGCWVWQGSASKGYGGFNAYGQFTLTHRFAYEALVGPIPDGLEVDHLCRNSLCANPDHLEPVTPQENKRRAMEARRLVLSTTCGRGHLLEGANVRIDKRGVRICKACKLMRQRRDTARARAEGES